MISIVNYGMGNIRSIQNALSFLGVDCRVVGEPQEIASSEKLILPGVGSFRLAMENIRSKKIFDALNEAVIVRKVPILGICLGMQLFADDGDEDGLTNGFGWIPGLVRCFPTEICLKVPHVGFNTVFFDGTKDLFKGFDQRADFYFVHSYRMKCNDDSFVTARCRYGEDFVAAVRKGNIFGVQFHPEKSQNNGLAVLKNFCENT